MYKVYLFATFFYDLTFSVKGPHMYKDDKQKLSAFGRLFSDYVVKEFFFNRRQFRTSIFQNKTKFYLFSNNCIKFKY